MVRHCAGLPLAIIVLGGVLARKNSLNEWETVSESVKSYLKRGKGQGIEDVLELSYDDLPPYLRSCFLYLSHFSEDYEISTKRLIQLWVAECIVLSNQNERNGGKIVEDVAKCYLIELTERCMIQVGERDALSKIKTCCMHDLMRDLCLSKAKEENFLCIVDHLSGNQFGKDFSSPTIRGVRRVEAHVFPQVQCIKSPHLRSFSFLFEFTPKQTKALTNPKIVEPNLLDLLRLNHMLWRSWTHMFNNFKLLRVLNFEGRFGDAGVNLSSDIEIGKLPEYHHFSSNIADIYLRICNLVEDPMPTLGRLPNLRILKVYKHAFTGKEMACCTQSFVKLDFLSIRRLHNLEEWKVDEGAMPALRHLKIYKCKNLEMLPNGLRSTNVF
ncbi:NB-ARC - like 10 [Theobroma cacao]|nr:NB-ARC - like 10 [Theobroma cacao]